MNSNELIYLNQYKMKTSPCFNEGKMWTFKEVPDLYLDGINVNVYKDNEKNKYYCLFDDEVKKSYNTQKLTKNFIPNVKYYGSVSGSEDCNNLYQNYKIECKPVDSTFDLGGNKIVPILKATTRNFWNWKDSNYQPSPNFVTLQDILDIFYITLRSNPEQIKRCSEQRDFFKNICLYKKNFNLDLNHEYNIQLYRYISHLNLLGQKDLLDVILTLRDLKNLEIFSKYNRNYKFDDPQDFYNLINLISRIHRSKNIYKEVDYDLLIDLFFTGWKSDPQFYEREKYFQVLFPDDWDKLKISLQSKISEEEKEFAQQFKMKRRYDPKVLLTPQKKKK